MKFTRAVLVLVTISVCPSLQAESKTGADEAHIRQVQVHQADAWNRHDAAAYGSLFTEDSDVVNGMGWQWRGRPEIEHKLAAAFAFVFRESILTVTDVQVRFLNPAIAIAHVRWTMVGAKTPPGMTEPREGIQMQVLKKQSGKWLIASFQNTNIMPEMPFPTGPPTASNP